MLEGMTERLEFTGVAETLVRLAGADDQTSSSASQAQLVWVRETRVLPSLLAKCAFPYHPSDVTRFPSMALLRTHSSSARTRFRLHVSFWGPFGPWLSMEEFKEACWS